MIGLDDYISIKTLRVTDLRVEPKKVRARYCVEQFSGEQDCCELIYSYHTALFDPQKPADINLASMMVVQVALNYGLFCETIEFDALFDQVDRRFLQAMLENSSREILTNKLLVDNVFVLPAFKPLVVEKQNRYTRAKLCFAGSTAAASRLDPANGSTNPDKYAILSSGGKDSLLTYGIIKEVGEAYPVFINEAGRHWFTAFNSYKYFRENEPNTEKPWCNSDRVFNWMLRKLPFVRKDFASIRADYYPLRLWTVAVFLFGVLPIVRRNAIGNILIGNEYDTTVKQTTEGISHYSGLFDQSRYFDNTMSRYYRDKGWQVHQYSLLRSMSELLIMKMLSTRYPDLQKNQVSCHAAHKVDGAMRPCGRCEKCRRIVGMLTVLGADPKNCGYTGEQIRACLAALEKQSVKQISSDASHLYYLLLKNNLIEKNQYTERLAKRHDEITKLRFDAQRSMLEDLPGHIREPLFARLKLYADGAVRRSAGRWQDIEIDKAYIESTPYLLDTL